MPTKAPAPIGHNQPPAEFISLPVDQLDIWPPAKEQADDHGDHEVEEEVEIIEDSGQRKRVVVRQLQNGRFEVLAGAHIVSAVARYNEAHSDQPRQVAVQVRVMDDKQAFHLLALDVIGHRTSPLARSRFFAAAIGTCGGVTEAAKMCRVSKAAISKHNAVAKAADLLAGKAVDPRSLGQRDAAWLVQQMETCGQEQREAAEHAIEAVEIGKVSKVLKQLRAALAPTEPVWSGNRRTLAVEGRAIGEVRFSRKRIASIRFDAGDATPDQIATAVRQIFEAERNQLN